MLYTWRYFIEVKKLQEYYNIVNGCSLSLKKDVDFDYVQTHLAKMAIHNDTLNTVIGEISVEQTLLRNKYTNNKFSFDVRSTDLSINHPRVSQFSTAKERNDYINFFLLKEDYKELLNLDSNIKDLEQILKLAHKKSRDMEKLYNKLKMLWETIQLELKTIKRIGSDCDFLEKIKKDIDEITIKPIFTDAAVEQLKVNQYNEEDIKNENLVESILEQEENIDLNEESYIDSEVADLLADI